MTARQLIALLLATPTAAFRYQNHEAAIQDLFGSTAATCTIVAANAANYCSATAYPSKIFQFICPVACAAQLGTAVPFNDQSYAVDRNDIMTAQYGGPCSAAACSVSAKVLCPRRCMGGIVQAEQPPNEYGTGASFPLLLQRLLKVPRVSSENCKNLRAIMAGSITAKDPLPVGQLDKTVQEKVLALRTIPVLGIETCRATYPQWNVLSTAGCYDVVSHQCQCTLTSKNTCPVPYVWVSSGCNSCVTQAPGNTNQAYKQPATVVVSNNPQGLSPGCYSLSSHTCDCTITNSAGCNSPGQLTWTNGCHACYGRRLDEIGLPDGADKGAASVEA